MKKYFKISFIVLALLGVLFTSCKKDYEEPPIQVLPVGTVYTIDSILKMESGTVFDTASVYGIVTADERSGNLYKAAFLQDRATGAAIELYMNATSGVRIGDSIRVYLKDVTYTMYNGLPQLSNFEADGHIIILANNKPIEPAETTIANIVAGNHLAGLVKLSNVMFTEKNTFAEPTTYGNRTLVDPTDFSKTVIVRTSNYANFANDSLPQGVGNLVCIASVYGSTWQLLIRSASELEFNGYTPGGGSGVTLPYYQDFASSFGTYSTFDVSGTESWEIDYNTAKMTGYVGGVNKANEDWLISSPVSLEGVSNVNLTMKYIARYFSNLNEDVTIQISTDYTTGDPTQATWTQMDANLSEGSNWNDFLTAVVDLSQFAGQTVTVAVKYVSNEVKAGTIEIQSLLIQEGNGGGGGGGGQSGEVQNMPYTQSFTTEFGTYVAKDMLGAQSWSIDYSTAKMTGYEGGAYTANEDWLISSPVAITGVANATMTLVYIGRYFNNINEEITIWASTNYTFGEEPTTASWTQVPATLIEANNWNDFITTDIDLTDYVGQTVTIAVKYTSTDTKAGTMEIQSITIQEGEAGGGGGGGGVTPGVGEGSGTQDDPYNVAAGIENECWECNNQTATDAPLAWVHGYIVGAVKNGTTSISSNSDIIWNGTFDSQTNVVIADDPTCNEIALCMVVNLPSGKPLRTQVNLVDHPENLGKTLAVYGRLRTYFGQAGLRDSGGTVNDFELEGYTPPTPGNEIFSETFANGQGNFVIENLIMPDTLNYVWNHDANYSCMKASAFVSGQAYKTESWLVSPSIDLTGVSTATLSFEQAVNYASPTGALSVMISTNYANGVIAATWTELTLSAWPAGNNWTFVTSTADLTPYVGQAVTIAFKYTSTATTSATWEVKNFVVEE